MSQEMVRGRRRCRAVIMHGLAMLATMGLLAPIATGASPAAWAQEGVVLVYPVRDLDRDLPLGELRFSIRNVTEEQVVVRVESRSAEGGGAIMREGEAEYVLDPQGRVVSGGSPSFDPLREGVQMGLWLDLEADYGGPFDFQGRRVVLEGLTLAHGILGLVSGDARSFQTVAVHHAGDGLLLGFLWEGGWAAIDLAASSFPTPRFDPVSDRLVLGGIAGMFIVIVLGVNHWLSRKTPAPAMAWPVLFCPACGRPQSDAHAPCCAPATPASPEGGAS